jgi:hypothetical protein
MGRTGGVHNLVRRVQHDARHDHRLPRPTPPLLGPSVSFLATATARAVLGWPRRCKLAHAFR